MPVLGRGWAGYLDFASQVMNLNLGHRHPRLVEAVRRQAETLYGLAPSFASEPRSELARLLAEVTPGDLSMTLFTTGGADANENAVKLARWVTGRQKVVARYRSYHGATAGAAALTGDPRRWPAEPAVPGVVRMLDPYPYRCPAGAHEAGAECPVCAGGPHLEEVLRLRGPRVGRRGASRDGHRRERRAGAAARLPGLDPRGLRPASASCSSSTK